jgi:ABC-type nickel/cobalt efflux system permease component RcnA
MRGIVMRIRRGRVSGHLSDDVSRSDSRPFSSGAWRGLAVVIALGIAVAMAAFWAPAAWAQGAHPFGVPEAARGGTGPEWLSGFFGQVSIWQSHFYRQLTQAVRAWQQDGHAAWTLIGLSFAYGVFHAMGPGHGKAVITAYVLANRQTARNGALLAMLSALVQALVAIAMVLLLAALLNVTAATMNQATWWLEAVSYAVITALGAYLVWTRAVRPLWRTRSSSHAHDHADAHVHSHAPMDGHAHTHHHKSAHDASHAHHHDHVHDDACGCGHAHVPDPALVSGPLNLRRAWSAIAAVGLRPCSGAIIVLVFALSQDFLFAGIASALAMGLGTGLTVAALACLAVGAGALAERIGRSGGSRWLGPLRYGIQALAAIAVLLLGISLLGGQMAMMG